MHALQQTRTLAAKAATSVALLFTVSGGLPAHADAYDPSLEWQLGMPKDVQALMKRVVWCHHFAGEEGYNAQRRAQISRAVQRLRCDDVTQDHRAALRRHAQRPRVVQRLREARFMLL